ncbi:TetR/AcrR family transcriptional regulator [Oceanivirga salmonicida]|uniref:TetR/AcrR family transcriptional regulator n=1 Tax=Oceanivirga salmonicida TaxID=1769291 RepID=UPI000832285C|nr:TetR/AcrR family transcriptional regulator [Oceanivirga salmonicida]
MARNKFPEETINLILETASKLFIKKGYDNTTIQDILDETKLSKGAIYHHFKSKDDIFLKICDKIGEKNIIFLTEIINKKNMNGKEKLREMFIKSFTEKEKLFSMSPNLLNNPRFLAISIRQIYDTIAPDFIEPVIKEGIKDGSIKFEYPSELAELIIILTNIWLNPLARPSTHKDMQNRVKVFNKILKNIDLELFDDKTLENFID